MYLITNLLMALAMSKSISATMAFAVMNNSLTPYHLGLGIFIHPCAILTTWTSPFLSPYADFLFTSQQQYMPQHLKNLQAEYLQIARRDVDYVGASKNLVIYAIRPSTLALGLHRSVVSNLTNHPLENCFVVLPRRAYDTKTEMGMEVVGLYVTKATSVTKEGNTLKVEFSLPPYQVTCPVDEGAPLICGYVVVALLRDNPCDSPSVTADINSQICNKCDNPQNTEHKVKKRYEYLPSQFSDLKKVVKHMVKNSAYCEIYTPEEILSIY